MLQDISNSIFRPVLVVLYPLHEFLNDGASRYFWLYVLTGLVLAWFVCAYGRRDERGWAALFDRETWWSASARNDYLLLMLRPALTISIMSWAVVNIGWVATQVSGLLVAVGVAGQATDTMAVFYAGLLTVTLFIVDDALKWGTHYIFHRVPALWEFHKVHHSAEVLNFATSERFHPVETVLASAVIAVSLGIVNGIFIALAGHKLTPITVAGANVFLFAVNIFGGVLRHSPCWVAFHPTVERWIISPAMHQIHHSAEARHWDKNMGVTLSIWDRFSGTLVTAENEKVEAYGIGEETPAYRSFWAILVRPCVKAAALLCAGAGQSSIAAGLRAHFSRPMNSTTASDATLPTPPSKSV